MPAQQEPSHQPRHDDDGELVQTRLLHPGEGTAALSIAASAGAPVAGSALQAALDTHGGHVQIPDLPGAAGWCFGAVVHETLAGVLYACTPVGFVQAHRLDQRAYLVRSLIDIEIFAVSSPWRGQGVGTRLLRFAEQYLHHRGIRLFSAKVDATDMPVLRWYRHRGYTVARAGEDCCFDSPVGVTGISAGRDEAWRLAVKAPGFTLQRRMSGLWLDKPLPPA